MTVKLARSLVGRRVAELLSRSTVVARGATNETSLDPWDDPVHWSASSHAAPTPVHVGDLLAFAKYVHKQQCPQ